MGNDIFRIRDVFGNTVACSERSWRHIASGHDELEGREDDVARSISSPCIVYASKERPMTHYVAIAHNEGQGKEFIKTVVKVLEDSTDGQVITSYTAMQIEGDNIDASKKLYPEDHI